MLSRLRQSVARRLVPNTDPIDRLSDLEFLNVAYRMTLGREPDQQGLKNRLADLRDNRVTRNETLDELRLSLEAKESQMRAGDSLHMSRSFFVQSLPRAARIIDLGGVNVHDPRGAMVSMRYPYGFDQLVIVDLPDEDRHPLYQSVEVPATHVETEQGPVRYEYHSMADLSRYADESFDLVYSGQTFEHITRAEGVGLLEQVLRVLSPGGAFALDTPNRAATEVELLGTGRDFIDPDHKVEYHHRELTTMFESAGFEIDRALGLNLVHDAILHGQLTHESLSLRPGLYNEIESCYILAYVLAKP